MSVVVQDFGQYLNAITARKTGDMVLSRAYTYDDDSVVVNEFVRVNYDNLRYDSGAKSGASITLTGRRKITGNSSKIVEISTASYKGYDGKQLRYRCAIDDSVALADTVIINGDSFVVGKITYNANATSEQMELSEYVNDGSDPAGSIGSNGRPKALKQYSVVKSNSSYATWMSIAFYYAGITESTQTIGLAYTLYYDSTGHLFYLAGNEGAANVPVLMGNGQQAVINI